MTTVLMVEDNATLLENIAFELEMRGYIVWQAGDGRMALQVLQSAVTLPDIIVSDIAMPDIDGYGLLEQVRLNDDWQNIPFIFLTAFDSNNAIRLGKELGVDDYLVKPFKPEDLVTAIENKLKRYQQVHAHAQRQLDDTRRELLNVISHELFTPLTSIYGGTEVLAESLQGVSDEFTREMLSLIQRGAKRMNQLVNRILLLVQIDSGQLARSYKKTARVHDFLPILFSALEEIGNADEFLEKRVRVNLHSPQEEVVWVRGVYPFLFAVLEEAVRNAVKFSHAGGVVDVYVTLDPGTVMITVTDRGIGIPADKIHLVWEKFQQINRSEQEQQGMGLGLTIIQQVMAQHGGTATISSTLGVGTQLTLVFPRVADGDE